MKIKPLIFLSHSGSTFTEGLARTFTDPRRMVGGVVSGTGAGIRMSLGMVLASLMPQLGFAQDEPSASRQPIKHSRRAEQLQRADDKAFKPASPQVVKVMEISKVAPKRAEVVESTPKLNEKHLSAEELRILRKQLLDQR